MTDEQRPDLAVDLEPATTIEEITPDDAAVSPAPMASVGPSDARRPRPRLPYGLDGGQSDR